MHIIRTGALVLGTLTLVVVASPPARGQMRGGGIPATPVAAPLSKVPMGTWAEYTVQRGDSSRKVRYALVGKEGAAFVVESRSETGQGEKVLTRTVLDADPTQEGAVKKVVTQFGDADPMEMPAGRGAGPGGGGMRMGARYLKPDPKALLGKENVKVAAGAFQADHYRTEGPRGGTLDYWLARDAGPFGLVKLQMERTPGGPGAGGGDEGGGKVLVELASKGKGAKPELTRPAKPFDPEAMRARWGGRGPGGAPASN